jgi:hypothetical protein
MIYTSVKPKKKKAKYASAEHKKKELEAQALQKSIYGKWGIKETKMSKPKNEFVMNTAYRGSDQKVNSVAFTGGSCSKKEDKKYTGTLVVGISTMHKSNAVPIINQQQAEEIAKMRRG